jgi:transcriptional regulator NrdR family protein
LDTKIKEENRELQRQMQENVHTKQMGEAKIQELMNLLDEVGLIHFVFCALPDALQVYDQWKQLPWDEIEIWGVQTRDSLKAAQPA